MNSIQQTSPVRSRGDYDMINIHSLIRFLQKQGYHTVDSQYREQGYYEKTIQNKTAYHGQYRLNLIKPGQNIGLSIFSSTDCQLPLKILAGPRVDGEDVLPMVEVISIKHTKQSIDRIDEDSLIETINTTIFEVKNLLNFWQNTPVTLRDVILTYHKINDFKVKLMPFSLRLVSVRCSNKLELFLALVNGFLYGIAESETGRKPKAIVHLRRQIQMTQFIVKALI